MDQAFQQASERRKHWADYLLASGEQKENTLRFINETIPADQSPRDKGFPTNFHNYRMAELIFEFSKKPETLASLDSILNAGVPIDIRGDSSGDDLRTALHHAASEQDAGSVRALLRRGADKSLGDSSGASALHFAATAGGSGADNEKVSEVIWVLYEEGADVNAKDTKGWTPLMRAISYGSLAGIEALCALPTLDLNVRNADGDTARDVAKNLLAELADSAKKGEADILYCNTLNRSLELMSSQGQLQNGSFFPSYRP